MKDVATYEPRHPVSFVVAIAKNGVIGVDGGLPWRLPKDLQFFKRTTMGNPIVMGRKTWDSLPRKPLPGRPNIVVTRNPGFAADGAEVFTDVDAALEFADAWTDGEICVIGGAEIYRLTFPVCSRLYITEIDAEPRGDAWFPDYDRSAWREVWRETNEPAPDGTAYDFVLYERIGAAAS